MRGSHGRPDVAPDVWCRLGSAAEFISARHGFGSIARVIVGASNKELEWLEAATSALGGQVVYMPIRRADPVTVELETKIAFADTLADVGYRFQQAAECDANLAGERNTGRPDTDRELRRIIDQSRAIRCRALDRDLQLVSNTPPTTPSIRLLSPNERRTVAGMENYATSTS